VAAMPIGGGMDGVFFDARHKRIYVSCGRGLGSGFVWAFQQLGADSYKFIGKAPTRPGSGTSFWSPKLNRFYVAAPASDTERGAILVFEPVP
jgi:hypothetical protein